MSACRYFKRWTDLLCCVSLWEFCKWGNYNNDIQLGWNYDIRKPKYCWISRWCKRPHHKFSNNAHLYGRDLIVYIGQNSPNVSRLVQIKPFSLSCQNLLTWVDFPMIHWTTVPKGSKFKWTYPAMISGITINVIGAVKYIEAIIDAIIEYTITQLHLFILTLLMYQLPMSIVKHTMFKYIL